MNLHRISVRNQDGKASHVETLARSLYEAVEDRDVQSQVVKVERIHQSTGEVLGGFYNEQGSQKRSAGMANESSSQDSESIRQLVEIVQYLMVRDKGMRLGSIAHRKAQDTVRALVEK